MSDSWKGLKELVMVFLNIIISLLMKEAILLYLLVVGVASLTCSTYDFSQSTVRCVQSCPETTTLVNNYCLTSTQYIINSQVFTCSGCVSPDHTVCCPLKYYIQSNQCLYCEGQVYNNGQSCCSDDNYLDFSQGAPNCVPLSTGKCPNLVLASVFKVCCQTGTMFSVSTGQCVATGGMNCDSKSQVCCPLGQRL